MIGQVEESIAGSCVVDFARLSLRAVGKSSKVDRVDVGCREIGRKRWNAFLGRHRSFDRVENIAMGFQMANFGTAIQWNFLLYEIPVQNL